MGTDPTDRSGPAVARLRHSLSRLRGRLLEMGLAARLALALLVLVALFAGLKLVPSSSSLANAPLYGGYRFAPEDAQRVLQALEARSIAARCISGRIEVPASAVGEAHALLEKAGLAPRSSRALLDAPLTMPLLASPAEIEAARLRRRAQILEAEIHDIDPALSATVVLRPKRGRGLTAEDTLRATVKLTTDSDRPVAASVVEKVMTKVLAFEPDLKPEALQIVDRRGQAYLLPASPELIEQSSLRAREQELEDTILQRLDWIKGVRVEVQVVMEEAPPTLKAVPEAAIAVNSPLEGEPEPQPSPTRRPQVRVVVRVPATYYRQHAERMRLAGGPSTGDWQAFERKTADSIRSAVATAVPPDELDRVEVDRIFPSEPATIATAPTRTRLSPTQREIALAGAVVLVAVVAGTLGRRWRRPAARPTTRSTRSRLDVTGDPVGRAQELVRLDPAAAAGVLHRWVGVTREDTR